MMIEFKIRMLEKMFDVSKVSRDQVIHCDYLIAIANEPVTQVRSEKPGAAGY